MKNRYSQMLEEIVKTNQRVIARSSQSAHAKIVCRSIPLNLNDSEIRKAWSAASDKYEKAL